MSRPTDWSPLDRLDDPTPGDPHTIRVYATQYAEVAAAIQRASTRLTSIVNEQTSQSEFVEAFKEKATDVATNISKARERYLGVSDAVALYVTPLENAQAAADAALIKARNARDGQGSTSTKMKHYQDELDYNLALTDDEKDEYTRKLHAAQTDYNDAHGEIEAARQAMQDAITARDAAATIAVNSIKDVENSGDLNDSGWDNWVQFWEEHGELIDNLITVLSVLATIAVIILMFIPGVNAIVFTIITVALAAITIANALAQLSAGTKSLGDAILDIGLALLPVGGMLAAKSAVKVAMKAGTKTLMTSKAAQGIERYTAQKALEEIEEVTSKAFPKSVPNVLKAAFLNESKDVAELQALAKMSLVKSGVSERVAGIVKDQILWKMTPFLGPVPEQVLDIFGKPFISERLGLGGDEEKGK